MNRRSLKTKSKRIVLREDFEQRWRDKNVRGNNAHADPSPKTDTIKKRRGHESQRRNYPANPLVVTENIRAVCIIFHVRTNRMPKLLIHSKC